MAREKDPAEVIETIARSIQVSQRGARRVRAHRFKELFGIRHCRPSAGSGSST